VAYWSAGEFITAAELAAVGGEWALLADLPELQRMPARTDLQVLWKLIGGRPSPALPTSGTGPVSEPWLELAQSIPKADHAATAKAFDRIAQYWIGEVETWDEFSDADSFAYDSLSGAAAAIARHHGFPKRMVAVDTYRYLEAGLADGWPEPLYPFTFGRPG
jgi:hypothetical protein